MRGASRRWLTLALLALLFAASAFALSRLVELRFEEGDVYPPYSSLRSDPLGTRAFLDALGSLPGVSVERNYRMIEDLEAPVSTTLFVTGVPGFHDMIHLCASCQTQPAKARPGRKARDRKAGRDGQKQEESEVEEELVMKGADSDELESYVLSGGRLVLTFSPTRARPREVSACKDPRLWGFSAKYEPVPRTAEGARGSIEIASAGALFRPAGKRIGWHSTLVFVALDPAWRPILIREGAGAVVIERSYGKGSIVVASDTFFLSNEALRVERHAELLAWIAGERRRVVFDETHFGIIEQPGITTLARSYKLEGLFAGLILLAALYVWQASSPLVPPDPSDGRSGFDLVTGRDSLSGLTHCLRRNIPRSNLVRVCVDEWKRTAGLPAHEIQDRSNRIEALLAAEPATDPVSQYQKIVAALARPSRKSE